MKKKRLVRNKLGQFRVRLHTPVQAGRDSVISGADAENCHFAWFTRRDRTKEWEHGRDSALRELEATKGEPE